MATSPSARASHSGSRSLRKPIVIVLALLFFGYVFFTEVLDPWADQPYVEVSHGDHTHYLPKEADLDEINVSTFPTSPPGPNEVILMDGRIVPREQVP